MKKLNRVGEKYITQEGYPVTVIKYDGAQNITVQFEDGTIAERIRTQNLIIGYVKKPLNRVGEKHLSNEGYWMTIIAYRRCNDCDIQFDNGVTVEGIQYQQ